MDVYLESFDIRAVIEDVSATIAPLATKNANTLTILCADEIGDMVSDLTKIRQTLFNLLSNACKFTDSGTITLKMSESEKTKIIFDVMDTGIGMSPDQAEAVFGVFQQADSSTTREYGGTGLGLAIARNFCELLGAH
jgi:signal transduction histidine kinase